MTEAPDPDAPLPDLPLDFNTLKGMELLPPSALNSLFALSKKNATIREGLGILQNVDRRKRKPRQLFISTDQGLSQMLKKTRICIK